MTIHNSMKTIQPREFSGSRTAGRYDFQANFAILKLIELREKKADFRVVFDFYDDLLVLDSATNPSRGRFFQLKSKDPGEWTIKDVSRQVGAKSPRSIVGRMYAHVDAFGDDVQETAFVTNAPFKFTLSDGTNTSADHTMIVGNTLHATETGTITVAVTGDIASADVNGWLPRLVFIRTSLGIHGQELVVVGRLQHHLEQEEQACSTKTTALYKTLHASVVARSKFSEQGLPLEELLARKSLTKAEIDELIAKAKDRGPGFLESWPQLSVELTMAGISSKDQIKIKNNAISYYRDRNGGNGRASKLALFAESWVKQNTATIDSADTVLKVANEMLASSKEAFGYSQLELLAAFLFEAHEVI